MKRIITMIIVALCGFTISSLSGCTNTTEKYEQFMRRRINIPYKDLVLCSDDSIGTDSTILIHIVYVPISECDKCIENKLELWHSFAQKAEKENPNYRLCFILSHRKNAVTKVKQLLHYLNFNPVVYEDTSHVVENSVPGIESSYHYSSFILDKDGMIKVLGDPTANYSIEKLMLRHLKQQIR